MPARLSQNSPPVDVQITPHLRIADRRRRVNQYICGVRIGKGQHGEVFLCEDEECSGREVALKIVKRNNPKDRIKLLRRNHQQTSDERPPLSSTEHSIRREIAIMKKCRHANIARLYEVIDDPKQDKIYMAMEYLPGGPVQWANDQHKPILAVSQTRRIIRDVILGLEYLHHQGIIHRDIKPANILWTLDRASVKIIDFGVSHLNHDRRRSKSRHVEDYTDESVLFSESDLLKRTGTPSFLAPEVVWFTNHDSKSSPAASYETLASGSLPTHASAIEECAASSLQPQRPPITKAIDVWALAVTFYCLLFGHTPFNVPVSANKNVYRNEFVLYHQICTQDWTVDETAGVDQLATGGRHPKDSEAEGYAIIKLLDQMLEKDPRNRIALAELKRQTWFLRDIANPKEWLRDTAPESPSAGRWWFRQISRRILEFLSM